MTPQQLKAIIKDLRNAGNTTPPICAFQLRSGPIHTGEWEMLGSNLIVVTLVDREAPPIYIDVIAVDAIAVSNSNGARGASGRGSDPVPLPRAASPRHTSSHGGSRPTTGAR